MTLAALAGLLAPALRALPGLSVFVLLFGITLHGTAPRLARRPGCDGGGLRRGPAGTARRRGRAVSDVISTLLATAVAWLAGDNLRQRRLRWAAMEERARMLEREREDRDRAAVAAERLRIARELHDVVAHSMSVIAVQAGVGRHVIDTDVSGRRDALGVIESTSRDALAEMRRMLGVLRQEDEVAAMRPDARSRRHPGPRRRDAPGRARGDRRLDGRGRPTCPRASTSRHTASCRRP